MPSTVRKAVHATECFHQNRLFDVWAHAGKFEMTIFFVGGNPRSGTSLLHALMCSDEATHPKTAECNNLAMVVNVYVHGKSKFASRTNDFFADEGEFKAFCGDMVLRYLSIIEKNIGSDNIVLKDPMMTGQFPRLS